MIPSQNVSLAEHLSPGTGIFISFPLGVLESYLGDILHACMPWLSAPRIELV
jgi:hypothetical protein